MVRALHAVSPVPFELWREEGVLRVVLCRFMSIGTAEVKEIVRMLGSLDAHVYPTARKAPSFAKDQASPQAGIPGIK